MMDFIKDLQESRMTRQGDTVKRLTFADCCENMYLTLLALEILTQYPKQIPMAKEYARRSKSVKYDKFKIDSTDLYNFIYFINGDEVALGKLKDPGSARRTQSRTALPLKDIQNYLVNLSVGRTAFVPQQMFIRIENGLNIRNAEYKELRRYLVNFSKRPDQAKKNIITKLMFALRSKLRNSDIIDIFSAFVSDNDLESQRVKDTEDYPSTPDVSVMPRDLMYYRHIDKSIPLVPLKNFLDHTMSGRLPTREMVKAYVPIIESIDDIIKAGPTHIHMLKTLHNRAKKSKD